MRLRRLLRLRRRDRRRAEAPVRRRAGAVLLLNASGCLDALTAPETARALDAFVTKTVTPEPRDGNPPVRIAETDHGMLNAIGLANPGRERFLADTLPRLRELGRADLGLGRRLYGPRLRRDLRATRTRRSRVHRAQPLLPERRRGARRRRGDRRRLPRGDRDCRSTRSFRRIPGTSARPSRAVEAAGADGLSASSTRCAASRSTHDSGRRSRAERAGTRDRR